MRTQHHYERIIPPTNILSKKAPSISSPKELILHRRFGQSFHENLEQPLDTVDTFPATESSRPSPFVVHGLRAECFVNPNHARKLAATSRNALDETTRQSGTTVAANFRIIRSLRFHGWPRSRSCGLRDGFRVARPRLTKRP